MHRNASALVAAGATLAVLAAAGCGTTFQEGRIEGALPPVEGVVRFRVDPADLAAGAGIDAGALRYYDGKLSDELVQRRLMARSGEPSYRLRSKVLRVERDGRAWLGMVVGAAEAVGQVRVEVIDGRGATVGSFDATETESTNGVYWVGAQTKLLERLATAVAKRIDELVDEGRAGGGGERVRYEF